MNPLAFVREKIWSNLPTHVTRRQQNWAALLWGLGLVALGLLIAWKRQRAGLPEGDIRWACAIAGGVVAFVTLLPKIGPWFYLSVLRLLSPIGFVVMNAMLIFFYFLCMTPLAWLLRASGKDPLNQRQRHHAQWIAHTSGNDRKRYYRLF